MTEKDRYDHGLPPVRGTGTCFCKSVFRHLDRKTSMSRTREGSVTVQSGMDREPFENPFLRAKNSLFCTKLCYLSAVCPPYGWFLKDRKAIQEPVEFFGRNVTHIIPCPGPFHTAFLDPFVKENESVAFLSEYSDKKVYPQPFVIRIYFENSLSLTVLQVLFSPKYSDKNP